MLLYDENTSLLEQLMNKQDSNQQLQIAFSEFLGLSSSQKSIENEKCLKETVLIIFFTHTKLSYQLFINLLNGRV